MALAGCTITCSRAKSASQFADAIDPPALLNDILWSVTLASGADTGSVVVPADDGRGPAVLHICPTLDGYITFAAAANANKRLVVYARQPIDIIAPPGVPIHYLDA